MNKATRFLGAVFSFFVISLALHGQTTAFTYQGRLNDGLSPANGTYDLRFTIYDAASGGNVVGGSLLSSPTVVSNGLFTVALDFGSGVFNGNARWLGIDVRTNGAASFVTLTGRQQINSTPYAVTAANLTGTVANGSLSGTYSSPVSLLNSGNQFAGNGSGLTALNADQLTSGTVPDARIAGNVARTNNVWTTTGNAGTTANNFVGTTDNQALELRVNNQRGLRLEPTTGGANVIGGAGNNYVDPGTIGATIGGGGALNYLGVPNSNHVAAIFGTVAGGRANTVRADSGTIGGGFANTVSEAFSTVAGGQNNFVQTFADRSFIGGGFNNNISGASGPAYHVVSGGYINSILTNSSYGVIGGGQQNTIQSNANQAAIGGGSGNIAISNSANVTIAGGSSNKAGPGTGSTVGGGIGNIANGSFGATVAGGRQNSAVGEDTTVSGGAFNLASNTLAATVGGGYGNKATGSNYATVAGGGFNIASGDRSTVGGGDDNTAGGTNSTVGGGSGNFNTGAFSTIPGGYANFVTGNYSFAGGVGSMAMNDGSFVWSDASDVALTNRLTSTASNQFSVRALGGVRFITGGAGVTVDGVSALASFQRTTTDGLNHTNIVNVALGSSANYIPSGIYGATISGGGASYFGGVPTASNVVTANFGTIAGGFANDISGYYASIGGGYANTNAAPLCVIGGGNHNTVSFNAFESFIGGGVFNSLDSVFATVTGGAYNNIGSGADSSTIAGGYSNTVSSTSHDVAIGGGSYNFVGPGSYYTTIGGGRSNNIADNATSSRIGGGFQNSIQSGATNCVINGGMSNSIGTGSVSDTIGGGNQNTISNYNAQSTIAGGNLNTIGFNNFFGTISGGYNNSLQDHVWYSTIAGGIGNSIGSNSQNAVIGGGSYNRLGTNTHESVIAGGSTHYIGDNVYNGFIGGGWSNTIAPATAGYSTIAGGVFNLASAPMSAIGGGYSNVISSTAQYAAIPGGYNNTAAGLSSFAAGQRARANHDGSFVWADASDLVGFASTTSNQFNIRALGGVRVVTGGAGLTIDGIAAGGSTLLANDGLHSNIVNVLQGSPNNYIASGVYGATISGGGAASYSGATGSNSVTGDFGTVGGGWSNSVYAPFGTVGGGGRNSVQNGAYYSTIAGGFANTLQNSASYSFIGSGFQNLIASNSVYSVIGGGIQNNFYGVYGVISGGYGSFIGTNSYYDVVGGGAFNLIGSNMPSSTIAGGYNNSIGNNGADGSIGGGSFNAIGSNAAYAVIAGGRQNTIGANTTNGTIVGGMVNNISALANNSVVLGGTQNTVAVSNGVVAGHRAIANHHGSFVFADDQEADFATTRPDQFLIRASGGVGINNVNSGGLALAVTGIVQADSFVGGFHGDGSGLTNLSGSTAGFNNYVCSYTTAIVPVISQTVFRDIPFATDTAISGWSHSPGSASFICGQLGTYMVQYTCEASATGSTYDANFSTRAILASNEVIGSEANATVTSPGEYVPISKTFLMTGHPGDTLTLQFTADTSFGAQLAGTGNASVQPSATMTITRIQ